MEGATKRFFEVILSGDKSTHALRHLYLHGFVSEENYIKGEFVLQTPPSFPDDLHLMCDREDRMEQIENEKKITNMLNSLL